jgi:ribosomal protein S18
MLYYKLSRPFANNARKIVSNEFFTNPHFLRAFPHLASKVTPVEEEAIESSWAKSLQYKFKIDPKKDQEIFQENEANFMEGYQAPKGPLKWLSDKEKQKVHDQIDFKMAQLERTGLSRDEILYNKPGGIPLAEDPVFQFLKNNPRAREMMLGPGEEFTVQKVIDRALRQDTGPDRSKTWADFEYKYNHELPEDYELQVARGKMEPDKLKSRDYYWDEDKEGRTKEYNIYYNDMKLMFPTRLPTKNEFRRNKIKLISKNDINYKNTEFLAQFMTSAGKIKNRWQTRLTGRMQRKVAKAIKHARNLNLFPFVDMIHPPHKQNLLPLAMNEYNRLVIHAETGTIYAKLDEKDVNLTDSIEFQRTVEKQVNSFFADKNIEEPEEANENKAKFIERSDFFVPNSKQIDILEAQKYLRTGQGQGKDLAEQLQKIIKDQPSESISELYISELAADTKLLETPYEQQPEKGDVDEIWASIIQLKKKFGVPVRDESKLLEKIKNPKPHVDPSS